MLGKMCADSCGHLKSPNSRKSSENDFCLQAKIWATKRLCIDGEIVEKNTKRMRILKTVKLADFTGKITKEFAFWKWKNSIAMFPCHFTVCGVVMQIPREKVHEIHERRLFFRRAQKNRKQNYLKQEQVCMKVNLKTAKWSSPSSVGLEWHQKNGILVNTSSTDFRRCS